jgi:N-acetyl-alpha-D-muramate 1-phosphate uridylyltransferase
MAQIDTAMVLAAGLGTRMRPLTDRTPKPLVELGGRPLLDHVLDRLAAAGIGRAVVNVHHFADQIEAHLTPRRYPAIKFSNERGAILETGGGVLKALPDLGSRPFIVHNSDSVWTEYGRSNLGLLKEAWAPQRMDALLLLAPCATSIGYDGRGDYHLDATTGRLRRKSAGEQTSLVFAGVSILKPQLFDGVTDRAFSLVKIFDRADASKRLCGVVLEGTWMHVGTPAALKEAEEHLANIRLPAERHPNEGHVAAAWA